MNKADGTALKFSRGYLRENAAERGGERQRGLEREKAAPYGRVVKFSPSECRRVV
jgi:hypothetical protein